jgi:NAD(P)H-hydrate epimerase
VTPDASPPSRLLTPEGVLAPTWSPEEARRVLRIAAEQTGPSALQLLEHAGMAAALLAIGMLEGRAERSRVIVLVGPGGTGAAGVCAARHLANRGVEVLVVTARRPAQATGPLGQQFLALGETSVEVLPFSAAFDVATADLVLDAVLSTGLEGAPRAAPMGLVRATEAARAPVLALDLPSGLDGGTGVSEGAVVAPAVTLAFGLPLEGLRPRNAGTVWLADLGLPRGVFERAGLSAPPVLFGTTSCVPLSWEPVPGVRGA